MDANQIEKLKALALAAGGREWIDNGTRIQERRESGEPPSDERLVWWYDFEGDTKPEHLSHVAASNPAAVLELIAEVERLRAELAAGAAREGGNTSENAGQLDHAKTAETRMDSGFEGGHLGSAHAAGTVEKDAALCAVIDEAASALESAAKHNREQGRTVFAHAQQDRADRLRAAIEAHTKAGKGNA